MNNTTYNGGATKHSRGYLALVLHAHLPYVRHLEYDDALEERWLFEAVTETYIPLLLLFDKLIEDKIDFRLTMSISPPLAAMLEDSLLKSRYLKRLEALIELSRHEISRTRRQPEFHALALFYQQHLMKTHNAFLNRYNKNLVQAFKRLQDLGRIEIIASAATHGYLPLLAANSSTVRAQIRIGTAYYQQLFDRAPQGFWLPECGYCSTIDKLLAEQAIGYTILETHGLTRSRPQPKYGVFAPISCPAGTIAFGRDPEASRQVWSSESGYPGDYDYREFYRDI
ncbi:Glycogen branching enzyme, GH-57-type, archaeal, partial [hydrothermal vent metagenome]